jgi:RND family efflux transporter MFP subunit
MRMSSMQKTWAYVRSMSTRISRKRVWLGAALVLAVSVIALASVGHGGGEVESTPPDEQPVLTVQVTTPRQREWRDDIAAQGSVLAWEEATIGAQLGGLPLVEIRADVGSQVAAGELLARFDPAPVQAELNERIAMLAETEALLAEAEQDAARAQSLKGTGALSTQAVTQYLTRAQTARAQVGSARARVDSLRLRLQQTRVVAPDAGVISARSATLGSVAASGQELFRLVRQNRLEWRAQVAAAEVTRVAAGQVATIALPDGSQAAGIVRQVAPVLDQSLTAIIYVQLHQQATNSALRIGMFVNGVIVTGASHGLSIPSSSVVVRDGREYVFVLDGESVVQTRITTGRRDGAEIELLSGIAAGQALVLSGGAFLHDGDRVRLAAANATANGTSGLPR